MKTSAVHCKSLGLINILWFLVPPPLLLQLYVGTLKKPARKVCPWWNRCVCGTTQYMQHTKRWVALTSAAPTFSVYQDSYSYDQDHVCAKGRDTGPDSSKTDQTESKNTLRKIGQTTDLIASRADWRCHIWCHPLHRPEQYTPPPTTEVPLNNNSEPLPELQPHVNQPQTGLVQEPPMVSPAQAGYQSLTHYTKITLHNTYCSLPILL